MVVSLIDIVSIIILAISLDTPLNDCIVIFSLIARICSLSLLIDSAIPNVSFISLTNVCDLVDNHQLLC